MNTLDEYLSGEFHTDRQEVAAIDGLIVEASRTLIFAFTDRGWPYKVEQANALEAPSNLSHSTTAMAALAIARLLGRTKKRPNEIHALRFPFDAIEPELQADLEATEEKAFNLLVSKEGILKDATARTESLTFGNNDVITLAYLLDLARVERASHIRQYWEDETGQLTA